MIIDLEDYYSGYYSQRDLFSMHTKEDRIIFSRFCANLEVSAALFRISPKEFDKLVEGGKMPQPCTYDQDGAPYWDVHDLRKVSWELGTYAAVKALLESLGPNCRVAA